ncbi:MAG: DUF4870 domain-containing protein [Armatimonadota bacterium]
MSAQSTVQQLSQEDERWWGMLCHLTGLAGLIGIPFGNIIGPWIVWRMKRNLSDFVNEQGKAALNFQLNCYIYLFLAVVAVKVGLPAFTLLVLLFMYVLVSAVIGSIMAIEGRSYRYPLTIKFIR